MTLADRIDQAESLIKQGIIAPDIIHQQTGLSTFTATCIVSRVTGQSSFDGLKKCLKEDRQ